MRNSISALFKARFALVAVCLLPTVCTTMALGQARTSHSNTAPVTSQVDVNSADLKSLETLPGVGPTIAQRIIDGRPYRTASDLEKVKGMGPAKVAALKDRVTFGGTYATTTPAAPLAQPRSSANGPTPTGRRSGSAEPSQNTSATPSRLAAGEKLNINTATVAELDALPGIGPVKAQAIVDYRKEHGKFNSIEEIEKVKGIKSGEFSKIKDSLKVSD